MNSFDKVNVVRQDDGTVVVGISSGESVGLRVNLHWDYRQLKSVADTLNQAVLSMIPGDKPLVPIATLTSDAALTREVASFEKALYAMFVKATLKKSGVFACDENVAHVANVAVSMRFELGGKLSPLGQFEFDLWMAAKNDARPVVEPFKRGTHIGSAWTYHGARGGMMFPTKEAAIKDAIEHGYRCE